MSNENGNLGLSPALKAIREECRKPSLNCLAEMRNDWNGVREFLLGGVRSDGIWPAGTISIRVDGGELVLTLSIHSLEIDAKYRHCNWDQLLEQVDKDLVDGKVQWKLDWRGKERLDRRVASS